MIRTVTLLLIGVVAGGTTTFFMLDLRQPSAYAPAGSELVDAPRAADTRVSVAGEQPEQPALEVERLADRLPRDAESTFDELLRLQDPYLQRRAAAQAGAALARQDPQLALAQAPLLPDDLQSVYRAAIYKEWARLDGAGFLAHIETTAPDPQETADALQVQIAGNPEGVLAVAERMTDPQRAGLMMTAVASLALSDPHGAMARVEAMPPGLERDSATSMVAVAYALEDPDAALAWVERVAPASPAVRMGVYLGISQRDPARALELLAPMASSPEGQLALAAVIGDLSQSSARAARAADDLAERGGASAMLLANLISGWMQRDPHSALEWVVARDAGVDARVIGLAASQLTARDPAMAAAYLDRIPATHRSEWIARVASAWPRQDPAEARRLLDRQVIDPALRSAIEEQLAP